MIKEINFKLEQLGEYVSILREYQHYDIEEVMNSHTLRGRLKVHGVSLACRLISARWSFPLKN